MTVSVKAMEMCCTMKMEKEAMCCCCCCGSMMIERKQNRFSDICVYAIRTKKFLRQVFGYEPVIFLPFFQKNSERNRKMENQTDKRI